MIKNLMYLSITAFVLFKLFDGTDWHKVEVRALRTYQGAAAGYKDGEPEAKPVVAKPIAAVAATPVTVAAEVAAVVEQVAGCTDNCEGEEPAAAAAPAVVAEVKPDSPTVVTLPAPDVTAPVAAATNGQ